MADCVAPKECADPEDKLFEVAKICRSVDNLLPLQTLCMKAVIKNFEKLSSPLECSVSDPMKTLLLEFLLEQTKLEKEIPLTLDQRLALVKVLLNPNVKRFDFSVTRNPVTLPVTLPDFEACRDEFRKWDQIFDDIWTQLSAKSPNLLYIREIRPKNEIFYIKNSFDIVSLNINVYGFSKLIGLDTRCFINSESVEEICKNLKQLKRLKANYKRGTLNNAEKLCQLEDLELNGYSRGQLADNEEMTHFMQNYLKLMPKLKRYQMWLKFVPTSAENLYPSMLEECGFNFKTNEDVLRLANCMPNLRLLMTKDFPPTFDVGSLQQLKNLTSLHIPSHLPEMFDLLASIGPQLKELFIWEEFNHCFTEFARMSINFYENFLNVFLLCPKLEILEMGWLFIPINLTIPVDFEHLVLRKLRISAAYASKGVLELLCKAPLLEDVDFVTSTLSVEFVNTLNLLLSQRLIFQHLVKFKFDVYKSPSLQKVSPDELQKLAKNIVTFCPKLQLVPFCVPVKARENECIFTSSLLQFYDLVTKF